MSVFMVIMGVLMIICGVCCAFTPLVTMAAAGYFIAILLIASGISGIIAGVRFRFYGLNFAVSILALILGIVALFLPGGIEAIDKVLIILFGVWLLVRGCVSVALSLRARKLRLGNGWILGLIIGILSIVLGIYSFVHPMVSAIAIGLLIAFYFIEEGIDVIAMSRVVKTVTDSLDEAAPAERE